MRNPRCAVLACALLAVGCQSRASAVRHPHDPMAALTIEHYRLANGLEIILQPDPSVGSVVVHVWYHVGSKDEVAGKTGFAHLFEHVMFKGSKHVGDGQFDLLLEEAGGVNNGTTNNDRTNYFEQLPSGQLALALWLEADRMAGLWDAVTQATLDNQRDVVKNERRQSYEDRPYGMADLALPELLWPAGHGNAHPTIGSMADLSAATLADVEDFWRTFYIPANATLVVVGNFDVATARRLIDTYFAWMPSAARPVTSVAEAVTPLAGPRLHEATDDVSADKAIMVWRAPPAYSEDIVAMQVLAYILGGSESSRLVRRLTITDQLAIEVAAFVDTMRLGSEFHIHTVGRDGVAASTMAAVVTEELARIAADGATEPELIRARQMIKSSLLRGIEALISRAETLAEYAAYTGNPRYAIEDLRQLDAVTSADLQRLARTWLAPSAALHLYIRPALAAKGIP
ncbi:MAG: insulinase family protein [Myxococcales bacterium]|nr:insulinase family protein [Myxococcales bacterium]